MVGTREIYSGDRSWKQGTGKEGSRDHRGENGALERTFPMTDAVGRHGPPNVDDATTIGHLILVGVLAGVVIIQGMYDAQI